MTEQESEVDWTLSRYSAKDLLDTNGATIGDDCLLTFDYSSFILLFTGEKSSEDKSKKWPDPLLEFGEFLEKEGRLRAY